MRKIHYSGEGVDYMLPGWPCCGSGEFAFQVRRDGNHTRDVNAVTCGKCLKKMIGTGVIEPHPAITTGLLRKSVVLRAAKKKIKTLPDKQLNHNLSFAAGTMAEAYRIGVEEAQREICCRLQELTTK